MVGKCGPQGAMTCMYGSTCNETSAQCINCPAGFRDDNVVFLGNHNCGLPEVAMYAIYSIVVAISLSVGVWALLVAIRRKRNRMTYMLYLCLLWNVMIAFYALAHYLEGFTHGPIATTLYIIVLMLVNTQVIIYMHSVEHFMGLLCNVSSPKRVYQFLKRWYIFWMMNKLICGIIMLIGTSTGNVDLFNNTQVALICCLCVEVLANVSRTYYSNMRLVRAAYMLHSQLHVGTKNQSNPIIVEFATKVKNVRFFMPFYGLIWAALAVMTPILFRLNNGTIPYFFVMWAFSVFTWPMVGFRPILLLRSQLGRHMDKTNTGTGSETARKNVTPNNYADAIVVLPTFEADNNPASFLNMNRKTHEEENGHSAVLPVQE
jgi:hypothetical protein